jgi:hypothetical protein
MRRRKKEQKETDLREEHASERSMSHWAVWTQREMGPSVQRIPVPLAAAERRSYTETGQIQEHEIRVLFSQREDTDFHIPGYDRVVWQAVIRAAKECTLKMESVGQ